MFVIGIGIGVGGVRERKRDGCDAAVAVVDHSACSRRPFVMIIIVTKGAPFTDCLASDSVANAHFRLDFWYQSYRMRYG